MRTRPEINIFMSYCCTTNFTSKCAQTYVDPISVTGVKRISFLGEQLLNVPQTGDLELFRLLLDDLPVEGVDQRGRVEEQRTVGQIHVALLDGAQVVLGHARLANRPGRQIGDVIAVVRNLGEQRGHPGLSPRRADDGQQVAQNVRFGDRAVDVGDDDFGGGFPPINMTFAPGGALIGRGHAELSLVGARLEVQLFHSLGGQSQGLFVFLLFVFFAQLERFQNFAVGSVVGILGISSGLLFGLLRIGVTAVFSLLGLFGIRIIIIVVSLNFW